MLDISQNLHKTTCTNYPCSYMIIRLFWQVHIITGSCTELLAVISSTLYTSRLSVWNIISRWTYNCPNLFKTQNVCSMIDKTSYNSLLYCTLLYFSAYYNTSLTLIYLVKCFIILTSCMRVAAVVLHDQLFLWWWYQYKSLVLAKGTVTWWHLVSWVCPQKDSAGWIAHLVQASPTLDQRQLWKKNNNVNKTVPTRGTHQLRSCCSKECKILVAVHCFMEKSTVGHQSFPQPLATY